MQTLDSFSMQSEFYDEMEVAQNGLTAGDFLNVFDKLFFLLLLSVCLVCSFFTVFITDQIILVCCLALCKM